MIATLSRNLSMPLMSAGSVSLLKIPSLGNDCMSLPSLLPDLDLEASPNDEDDEEALWDGAQSQVVTFAPEEDQYDPSNPEFIAPASQEEVDSTNAKLLEKQIAKLESYAARKRSAIGPDLAKSCKVVHHYQNVLNSMKTEVPAPRQRSSLKGLRGIQSAPDLQLLGQFSESRPRHRVHSDELEDISEEHCPGAWSSEDAGSPSVDEWPHGLHWGAPTGHLIRQLSRDSQDWKKPLPHRDLVKSEDVTSSTWPPSSRPSSWREEEEDEEEPAEGGEEEYDIELPGMPYL